MFVLEYCMGNLQMGVVGAKMLMHYSGKVN